MPKRNLRMNNDGLNFAVITGTGVGDQLIIRRVEQMVR